MSSSSIPYLLEKLPHLKQLTLFFMPLSFAPDRYQIDTDEKCITFIRKDNANDTTTIKFDCRIDTTQIRSEIQDNVCRLTLPIIDDTINSDEDDDFPTAAESNVAKYSLIKCRFCEQSIYNRSAQSPITRIYPLPSEYWLELSDMWFCCQSHQMEYNAKEIRAKRNALLLGKLFIILHADDVDSKAVRLSLRTVDDEYSVHALSQSEHKRKQNKQNPRISSGCCHQSHQQKEETKNDDAHDTHEHGVHGEDHTSWDGVQAFNCCCSRCDTLLGICYKTVNHENEDDHDEQGELLNEFHFWKFELFIETQFQVPFARHTNAVQNVYRWYGLENYFATKILETKNARTIHKYLVHDPACTVFIRMNVMSTKCFIQCSALQSSESTQTMMPALKVLFVDSSQFSFRENKLWMAQEKGHVITSCTENVRMLLTRLRRHNELYPKLIQSQTFPQNMRMSFIRLLSKTEQNMELG